MRLYVFLVAAVAATTNEIGALRNVQEIYIISNEDLWSMDSDDVQKPLQTVPSNRNKVQEESITKFLL